MLLRQITLNHLLSFKSTTVELQALNVLIGPNAAGKSNLIEAISLLQAAPSDLRAAIIRGGDVRSWIWLGHPVSGSIASIHCELTGSGFPPDLRYSLEFYEGAQGFTIASERLGIGERGTSFFERSGPTLKTPAGPQMKVYESVLSTIRSPIDPTPITEVGRAFGSIQLYREFHTGPTAPSRFGVSSSASKDILGEAGDNLALVLHDLDFHGMKLRLVESLRRLSDRVEDVKVRFDAGIAQAYLQERGLREPLSAIRASDGTLRFLCLLAVLLHPDPPALICLEEPELGLHPEALQIVAEALLEAAERTQLIVTTHSESLVDALSERPNAVLVCERDFDDSTQFKRLGRAELDSWLEEYSLGELWRKGEIGGTRW